jgi:hypothetical protein
MARGASYIGGVLYLTTPPARVPVDPQLQAASVQDKGKLPVTVGNDPLKLTKSATENGSGPAAKKMLEN